jgi:hypothetical protein
MEIFIENIFRDMKNLFRDTGISTEKKRFHHEDFYKDMVIYLET